MDFLNPAAVNKDAATEKPAETTTEASPVIPPANPLNPIPQAPIEDTAATRAASEALLDEKTPEPVIPPIVEIVNETVTDNTADRIAALEAELAEKDAKLNLYEENEKEAERIREAMAKIKFYTLRRGKALTIDIPVNAMGSETIQFKFENGALRLHDEYLIGLFEGELARNASLRQVVYDSAEQQQQDIAAKYRAKALAENSVAVGASGSQLELNPAQQAELALRQQQAQGSMAPKAPSVLDRVETT